MEAKIVQNEQNRARNFIQPSGFHLDGARRTSKFSLALVVFWL
jgi:hypothetical protein